MPEVPFGCKKEARVMEGVGWFRLVYRRAAENAETTQRILITLLLDLPFSIRNKDKLNKPTLVIQDPSSDEPLSPNLLFDR